MQQRKKRQPKTFQWAAVTAVLVTAALPGVSRATLISVSATTQGYGLASESRSGQGLDQYYSNLNGDGITGQFNCQAHTSAEYRGYYSFSNVASRLQLSPGQQYTGATLNLTTQYSTSENAYTGTPGSPVDLTFRQFSGDTSTCSEPVPRRWQREPGIL